MQWREDGEMERRGYDREMDREGQENETKDEVREIWIGAVVNTGKELGSLI